MQKIVLLTGVLLIFGSLIFAQKFPNDPLTLKLIKTIQGTLIKVKDDRCGDKTSIKVSSVDKALDKIDVFFVNLRYFRNVQTGYIGYVSPGRQNYLFFVASSSILCIAVS
jgi:hypothetical protein